MRRGARDTRFDFTQRLWGAVSSRPGALCAPGLELLPSISCRIFRREGEGGRGDVLGVTTVPVTSGRWLCRSIGLIYWEERSAWSRLSVRARSGIISCRILEEKGREGGVLGVTTVPDMAV